MEDLRLTQSIPLLKVTRYHREDPFVIHNESHEAAPNILKTAATLSRHPPESNRHPDAAPCQSTCCRGRGSQPFETDVQEAFLLARKPAALRNGAALQCVSPSEEWPKSPQCRVKWGRESAAQRMAARDGSDAPGGGSGGTNAVAQKRRR